jgi:hypothetical protein
MNKLKKLQSEEWGCCRTEGKAKRHDVVERKRDQIGIFFYFFAKFDL